MNIFKRVNEPIADKVQGNVFFVVEVRSGRVFLKAEPFDIVEEVPHELFWWAIEAETLGLSGLAEFCRLPDGRCSIDWLADDGSPLTTLSLE